MLSTTTFQTQVGDTCLGRTSEDTSPSGATGGAPSAGQHDGLGMGAGGHVWVGGGEEEMTPVRQRMAVAGGE